MSKNRKNGKGGRGDRNGHNLDSTSDDESLDNASVYSLRSDNANSVEEDTEENLSEKYEEKMINALESATEKSVQTRCTALQALCELTMHHYMPEFVDDRKITILDVVERSIRKGKSAEQSWGARLAPLLVMQLGGGEGIAKSLSQILLTSIADKSVSFDARAKCCSALGLMNFLGGDDVGDLVELMGRFEGIFCGSYLKHDKTPSSAGADAGAFHSAALSAWGLLLTLIPSGDFIGLVNSHALKFNIVNFMGLLQSPHLEVRLAAGEVIALALECGRAQDEDFLDEYLTDLIAATKLLATDSHKYRAKRDRKQQRATFRDILRYLEEDIAPEINIRFGTETLLIDTWAIHHQYTSLCSVMGSGMSAHLAENDFLRDVFQLGAKVVTSDHTAKTNKQSKLERHLINAAAFKARTIVRNKNRDKRSAVFN